jgi:Ni,Fe-hydrogenase III small subunit
VKLDRDSVELRADQPGKAVVVVTNALAIPAQIMVNAVPTPGLVVTAGKMDLAAGESTNITITWTPVGTHVVPPPATCGVSVRPTGAILPFTVTFR